MGKVLTGSTPDDALLYMSIDELEKDVISLTSGYLNGLRGLNLLWDGIRDWRWSEEESWKNRCKWLYSRTRVYANFDWKDYLWTYGLRRTSKGAIKDLLRYIDMTQQQVHLELQGYKEGKGAQNLPYSHHTLGYLWDFFKKKYPEFATTVIEEKARAMGPDEFKRIIDYWTQLAKEDDLAINPELQYDMTLLNVPYGTRFHPYKLPTGVITGDPWQHDLRVKCIATLMDTFFSETPESHTALLDGNPYSIKDFAYWKKETSRKLYINVLNSFHSGAPKEKNGYIEWKHTHEFEHRIWMHESEDTIARALWNSEHPDEQLHILYEPNTIDWNNLTFN